LVEIAEHSDHNIDPRKLVEIAENIDPGKMTELCFVVALATLFTPVFSAKQLQVTRFGMQQVGVQVAAYPNKHDCPNFTHICKIFSQICVIFLQFYEKLILTNLYQYSKVPFCLF
jgi:hypothetical protein